MIPEKECDEKGGRILYLAHDSEFPSGGIKVIYRHVFQLVRKRFPAFVVHNRDGFKLPWFSLDVPILYADQRLEIYPNDYVVIPEDHPNALNLFRNIPCQKYIFCQNHYYLFRGLNGNSFRDLGISGLFCCSDIIAEFITVFLKLDSVDIVHNGIPLDVFKPLSKKRQIAYMSRKRPVEIEFVKNLFWRICPDCQDIPWVGIENAGEKEVAQILGESEVFLSTSLFEGFGLPPLEAMACGCIVVGFHGDGGRQYVSSKNGFWCEGTDLISCAKILSRIIRLIQQDNGKLDDVRQEAIATAHQYPLQRQERELIRFWSRIYS